MAVTLSKYGSSINRLLCHLVGLSTDTKPISTYTDKSGKVFLLENGSSFEEMDTDKKYLYDAENQQWNLAASGGGGGSATLIEKSITENGEYNASDDNADGYSKVTVDVPNTYTAQDEGKVVDNGVLVAQTAMSSEVTENGTVDTTLYNSVTVNVPSGGVEFKNIPTNFDLKTNIDNLDVVVPYGCTSIANSAFVNCKGLTSIEIPNSVTSIELSAFSNCTGLTSIEIPHSVTSMGSPVFDGCNNLEKIYVDKDENSLSGSPWGAPSTPQVIWRTLRYKSSCTEVASGTTLTGTVNATVGDLVVATFVIRGNTYTFDSGWTLLGIGDNGALNQRTAMAYKIATSSSESLTVTQDTAGRMYINLVSIAGASVGTFSGFTTQATGTSITLPKPQGLVIWGVSATYWGTQTPYQLWDISDKSDVTAIQLPNTTQPRCLTALDQSNNASETFTYSPDISGDAGLAVASLTITGIDNFWYYDD